MEQTNKKRGRRESLHEMVKHNIIIVLYTCTSYFGCSYKMTKFNETFYSINNLTNMNGNKNTRISMNKK